MNILQHIIQKSKKGHKQLAVLIDPDDTDLQKLNTIIRLCLDNNVDYFFVGGSLVTNDRMDQVTHMLKKQSQIPVIIFPGNPSQIHKEADAILLLSLISGRNPEMLIGKHVESAVQLQRSGLYILPTGYILVDGGNSSTVSYVSNTRPIPNTDDKIISATALAGTQLGMKLIYLEAGSGARQVVPSAVIKSVRQHIDVPLIVGGGIHTRDHVESALQAGADLLVVGNAIESNPALIPDLALYTHAFKHVPL